MRPSGPQKTAKKERSHSSGLPEMRKQFNRRRIRMSWSTVSKYYNTIVLPQYGQWHSLSLKVNFLEQLNLGVLPLCSPI